jgi:hypothetical protein
MCLACPSTCSLCLVCNKTVDIPVEYNCMGIPFEYDSVSYCLYTQSMGFDDAEKFCQGNGTSIQTQGHIASIKNAFVNSYLVGKGLYRPFLAPQIFFWHEKYFFMKNGAFFVFTACSESL